MIGSDIFINERVGDRVYEYIRNIVERYGDSPLVIYIQLTLLDEAIYIKVFEKLETCAPD